MSERSSQSRRGVDAQCCAVLRGAAVLRCCCQADAIELRWAEQLHSWRCLQRLSMLTSDATAIRRRAAKCPMPACRPRCRLAARIALGVAPARETYARVLTGVFVVLCSTSDHFATPGQLKLRFSCMARPRPIARVPGVMRRRSSRSPICRQITCSIIDLRRRLGV